jgi:hypothetical protein
MTSFFTSIIFDGTDIDGGGAIQSVATDGTNVYGAFGSGDRIVKVDGNGNSNSALMLTLYDIRGMVVAGGYLFVLDWTNGVLNGYLLSDLTIDPITSSTLSVPQGICTDWDGFSDTFNLYVTHENGENRIGYFTFDGTLSSMTTISTEIEGSGNERRGIVYRSDASHNYLYITTQDTFLVQIDITSLVSPIVTSINLALGGDGVNISWGIVSHPTQNIMYISDLYGEGGQMWAYLYTPDATTGSITSFSSALSLINVGSNTSVDTGDASISAYVAAIGMAYNVNSNGINLYFATADSFIVKLYPNGGSGIGGDPHILPCFGKLYTLDNAVKTVRLFENLVGEHKILITGETWFPPGVSDRWPWSYLKNITIKCRGDLVCIDLDTLTANDGDYKYVQLCDTISINEIVRVGKKSIPSKNAIRKIVKIFGGDVCVTLSLISDISLDERNDTHIYVESVYDFNKENFCGALIYKSEDNTLSS